MGLGNRLLLHILQHFPVFLIGRRQQNGDEDDEDHAGNPEIGIQDLFKKYTVSELLAKLAQNIFYVLSLHLYPPALLPCKL